MLQFVGCSGGGCEPYTQIPAIAQASAAVRNIRVFPEPAGPTTVATDVGCWVRPFAVAAWPSSTSKLFGMAATIARSAPVLVVAQSTISCSRASWVRVV